MARKPHLRLVVRLGDEELGRADLPDSNYLGQFRRLTKVEMDKMAKDFDEAIIELLGMENEVS